MQNGLGCLTYTNVQNVQRIFVECIKYLCLVKYKRAHSTNYTFFFFLKSGKVQITIHKLNTFNFFKYEIILVIESELSTASQIDPLWFWLWGYFLCRRRVRSLWAVLNEWLHSLNQMSDKTFIVASYRCQLQLLFGNFLLICKPLFEVNIVVLENICTSQSPPMAVTYFARKNKKLLEVVRELFH